MGMLEFSFPHYVYQQDAQPIGAALGSLWVDTNASPITTYVFNGSSWVSLATNVDWVGDAVAQLALQILINSVAAGSTLNDYNEIFVDEFTDADGTSDTIDVGNTTATFNTNLYENHALGGAEHDSVTAAKDADTASPHTINLVSLAAGFVGYIRCTLTNNTENVTAEIIQNSVTLATKVAECNAGGGTNITFSLSDYSALIDPAVDSGNFQIKLTTTADTIETDAAVSYAGTDFEYTNQIIPSDVGISPIRYYDVTSADDFAQTNALTIGAGTTHHQVFSNNDLSFGATITYDISLDGGSTWDTDQALNTKNAFGATTGTSMILKLNLNKGAGIGIATADDYAVILWN